MPILAGLRCVGFAVLLAGCLEPRAGAARASTAALTSADVEPTSSEGTPYVWKNVPILGGGFVTGVVFSRAEQELLYARTDIGGAYRWQAQTRRWLPITDGLSRSDANYMDIESLALDPTDANKVYLAVGTYTQDWAGTGAILSSADRGQSWHVAPLPIKLGGNEKGRSNGERLVVDPAAPHVLLFGSRKDGLWRSEDGARSWRRVETFPDPGGTSGVGIPIVVFPPRGATAEKQVGSLGGASRSIYAAVSRRDRSVLRSEDGGVSWQPLPEQPVGLLPSHMDFDAQGTLYVAYGNEPGPSDVTDGAVHRFEPVTGKWTDITPLKPRGQDVFGYGGLAVAPQSAGHLLTSSIDRWALKDEVWRSSDGGHSWQAVGQAGSWHSEGAQYLHHGKETIGITHWTGDIDIDPFHPARATIVGGTGMFLSEDVTSDSAVNWRFSNRGLEETAVLSLVSPAAGAPLLSGVGDICGFRHDELDAPAARGAHANPGCNATTGLDFAEREPGFVVRVGRVWGKEAHGAHSADGGASWSAFASEPEGNASGGAIAVSSDAGALLWTRKGFTPSVSHDRGHSWLEVAGVRAGAALPDWASVDLQPAADRVAADTFYLYDASEGNVAVSRDRGASFRTAYTALPRLAQHQLGGASITAVPGFQGHIWLTTDRELFRSQDGGQSFEHVSAVTAAHGLGTGKAAPGRSYPALYITGQVGSASGFFRSDDAGRTWVRLNDDAHQFGLVNLIEGDPRTFGRVYLGTSGRGVMYGVPRARQ